MDLLNNLSHIIGRRLTVRIIASIIAAGIVMTGGLIYIAATTIPDVINDKKAEKEIKQYFKEQYGMTVDVESYYLLQDRTDLFEFCEDYLDFVDKDNKTKQYMIYPSENTLYHIVCSWEKNGEIKDTYQYHRMCDIAAECGIFGYISFNNYYSEEGYYDELCIAFDAQEIFNHKKKFIKKFKKYVEEIKKEDFFWEHNNSIYVMFDWRDEGIIGEFEINQKADSQTEEKQYKQINKRINKK